MENTEQKFNIDSTKEELLSTFKTWKAEAKSYFDELAPKQKLSEQYYIGNQTDRELIPSYLSNTVENRIFESVETITPVVTANAHNFIVMPGSENEMSMNKANKLSKVLERKYQTLEVQKKLEQITRHMLLYRFGVAKWCWDEIKDDIDIKVIDPRLMLIPKMKLDPHDLPYKMEIQEYTKEEMEDYFPNSKIDDFTPESVVDLGGRESKLRLYRVYEVWTPELVAWFCCDQLLEKKSNPYWDFEGEEKKFVDSKKKGFQINKKLIFRNHFDKPTDPYVFFTTYDVSDGPVGSTSLVEIGIPLQDDINVQKRQIIDNLRRMGNGQVYVDKDAMTEEEANNITNEVGLIIHGEGVASQGKVKREQGLPLPNAHFSNLTHSESMFDNIMGVHGATRGASSNKTLGQDIISRQQDYTRIDLITRVINRGVARLANGLVQLMRMYYDGTKVIKILGEEGAVEFVNLNRDDIEDHIEIEVKSGQSLPMDKISQRTEAVQLWQLGAVDPVTLYERLEFPNPEKYANRLLSWKTGQLTDETNAKIKLAAVQSSLGMNAAKKESELKTSEEERKVETPQNVIQRATSNVGGTAPSLPKTPNLEGQSKK